jgi:hypothetical protein
MPTFLASRLLLQSREARRRARALERDLVATTGPRTLREAVYAPVAAGLGAASELAARLGVLQQPGLLRVEHRMGAACASAGSVLGLQGSATPLVTRLREDLTHLVVDRLRAPRTPRTPVIVPTEGWQAVPRDRSSFTVKSKAPEARRQADRPVSEMEPG